MENHLNFNTQSHISGSNIPICSPGSLERNNPGVNCVLQKNLENTISLIKRLYSVLMKRAISHECDGAKEPSYILNNELVEIFSSYEMVRLNKISFNNN